MAGCNDFKRRSFDCACRDKATIGSAQDDKVYVVNFYVVSFSDESDELLAQAVLLALQLAISFALADATIFCDALEGFFFYDVL